jgi:prephenate dehydrogenase
MSVNKIVIIGCGLVGGSLFQALARKRPQTRITCVDVDERVPFIAEILGAGARVLPFEQARQEIAESDLIVLSTPVSAIVETIERIAPLVSKGSIVTDVGSTKKEIIEAARKKLPVGVHFVGGHPMAGSEKTGVEAADPLLFNERVYFLCPSPETSPEALLAMISLVEDLHAVPLTLEPEEHDRIMAMVSHVPQLLSIALVHAAVRADSAHGLLDTVAGRGFLDTTRIAASDFRVWESILASNRDSIFAALDELEASLSTIRQSMAAGTLAAVWDSVSKRRKTMSLEQLPRPRKTDLRVLVDRCDEQILKNLGNRMRLVTKIGALKAREGAPIADPDRERRLIKQRMEWAKSLDLDNELVDELFSLIIKHSKSRQAKDS